MKSRFQKKNIRKSRRQSLRRKIQRGGQEINCKDYPHPMTCPTPCKRIGKDCMTEEEYKAVLSAEGHRLMQEERERDARLGRPANWRDPPPIPEPKPQRPRMPTPNEFLFGQSKPKPGPLDRLMRQA